jgi:hypothetical protein
MGACRLVREDGRAGACSDGRKNADAPCVCAVMRSSGDGDGGGDGKMADGRDGMGRAAVEHVDGIAITRLGRSAPA